MTDWNKPLSTDLKVDLLGAIKERDEAIAKMDSTGQDSLPVGWVRFANDQFQRWDGSQWQALASLYDINVARLNGQVASFYRNADNLNAGTVPVARLPNASTSQRGAVQLNDNITSTSAAQGATANAVKKVNDKVNGKAASSHSHAASDLPSSSTTALGVVQLDNTLTSNSTTRAATAAALKQANDNANSRSSASHGHGNASIGASGFMSPADKSKLDGSQPILSSVFGSGTLAGVDGQLVAVPDFGASLYRSSGGVANRVQGSAFRITYYFMASSGSSGTFNCWLNLSSGDGSVKFFSNAVSDNSGDQSPGAQSRMYGRGGFDDFISVGGTGLVSQFLQSRSRTTYYKIEVIVSLESASFTELSFQCQSFGSTTFIYENRTIIVEAIAD